MTAQQLLLVRAVPGSMGERERVAHVVAIPSAGQRPQQLKTRCGVTFAPGELELLDGPSGMPCEECLRRSATTYVNAPQQKQAPFVARRDGYVYEQLADHIARGIESGQLRPGTSLPSERELAKNHAVSLGTARHATDLLRRRGLVVTIRSKGTFVTDRRDRSERRARVGTFEVGK